MNKLKGYKFIKKKMTLSLDTGCRVGGITRRANATCSRRAYRVSTLDRDLLMTNIGLCFWFSSSLNKAAPTKASDTAK